MEDLRSFCSNLLSQMETELLNIRLEHPKTSGWSKHSIPYLQNCLLNLKDYIITHPFTKRSDEIYFFKEVKPVVLGRIIFMCEVINKDVGTIFDVTKAKDHLGDEMDEVDEFFKKHDDLYDYYKESLTDLDIQFFVRDVADRFNFRELPIAIDPVFFYGDPGFSTGFDYLFAQFRAFEMLRDHLENELEALFLVGDELPVPTMNFTGSPADFVLMVEMFNQVGMPPNPDTGQPFTDEELFQKLRGGLNIDLPEGIDFKTLKLISGNSDFPERMLDALDKLHDKWDKEQDDINYKNPGDTDSGEDEPKE